MYVSLNLYFPANTSIDSMVDHCWSIVYDDGPTMIQHWVDLLCFLGCASEYSLVIITDNTNVVGYKSHVITGKNL